MYGPLWRRLRGPWPVKVLQLLVLLAVVVVICFTWAFPAIAPHLPWNVTTVDTRGMPPVGGDHAPDRAGPGLSLH